MGKVAVKIIKSQQDFQEFAEQMKSELEENQTRRCSFNDMLKPRGSVEKESIEDYLYCRLMDCFESWTDPKHGDNPPVNTLMELLCTNLRDETTNALEKFFNNEHVRSALSKHNPNDQNERSL